MKRKAIQKKMTKHCNFFLFFIFILFSLTSCSRSIKIDITRRSSDLIRCEYVFGHELKTLKLENAILLQTGVMDTTDEQTPFPIAIIIIDKKEIILKLTHRSNEIEYEMTRSYEGEGYKLHLTYHKHTNDYKETTLKGEFVIEYQNKKSEYEIEGTACNL